MSCLMPKVNERFVSGIPGYDEVVIRHIDRLTYSIYGIKNKGNYIVEKMLSDSIYSLTAARQNLRKYALIRDGVLVYPRKEVRS